MLDEQGGKSADGGFSHNIEVLITELFTFNKAHILNLYL